jgi:hypothetical protein
VDQAAEPVAMTEPIEREELALGWFVGRWRLRERWPLTERPVRAMLVVMQRVGTYVWVPETRFDRVR